MESITRQLLVCLVISFFFCGLHCKILTYPDPGICEYDNDCLKGKAKCVRRECQCKERLEYGDGKTKCDKWRECKVNDCPSNSRCLMHPSTKDISCRCNEGYFGKPTNPGCMSADRMPDKGKYQFPCLSRKNCPTFSFCGDPGNCVCEGEMTGDGERCRKYAAKRCSDDTECSDKRAKCIHGLCRCVGKYTGDGDWGCREPLPCPKDFKCDNKNTFCLVDRLYPKRPYCGCNLTVAHLNIYEDCVDCLQDAHCKDNQLCIDQVCKCLNGLAMDNDRKCKPGPLHECKISSDCDSLATCTKGKCFCQEGRTGNGKFCRKAKPCQGGYKCHGTSKCVVDPLIPDMQQCVCNAGYRKKDDGECVEITECFRNQGQDCPTGKTCRKDSDSNYNCQDIDECSDPGICPKNFDCENSEGSYNCKCSKGYARNENGDCEDKDECSDNLDTCGSGEKCVNTEGGYHCECEKGYIKKDGSCVKKVECKCKQHEVCYKGECRCKRSYKKNKEGHCVGLRSGSTQVSGYLSTFIFGVLGSLVLSA